jgi:hypothetical protein
VRVVTFGRVRYEVVAEGCGVGSGKKCKWACQHPLTAYILKHGTNKRLFGMTSCIPGDQITNDEEIPDA